MSQSPAKMIGALAATLVCVWTGSASAQAMDSMAVGSGYSASDAELGSPTELRVELRGRVEARCDVVSPPAPMMQLSLNSAGQVDAPFALDCNAPFLLRVRSQSGGFANREAQLASQRLKLYEVGVSVETDNGRSDLGWCRSADLTDQAGGQCAYAPTADRGWSSGESTAINQTGVLRLRWSDKDEGPGLFGAYRDTITIEVEVRS